MRTAVRYFLAAACLFTVPAVIPAGKAEAVLPPFPPPVNYLRFFAETNGGGTSHQVYTGTEAVALARRFDTLVGLRYTFDDHAVAMRAANPQLRLLAYMNGAMSKPSDWPSLPEAWFLHDRNGNRIRNLHFDLMYMDVGNAGWRNFAAQRCGEWIATSGYDGCWMDDMGAGNLGVNLSGWPIDPRTGQEITKYNWIGYAAAQVQVVRNANPGKVVSSNGLNNGGNYFELNCRRVALQAHASMAEGWLRGSTSPPSQFRTVERWKQDVDMLIDVANAGSSVLAEVKLWGSETVAQQNQWREYAYASFLLGTNGYQHLYFSARGPGKPDAAHAIDSFNLGTPTESYVLRNGVYQRRYTLGLAMVNPGSTPKTVSLGGSYRLADGSVVTQLTMPANTGRLLRIP